MRHRNPQDRRCTYLVVLEHDSEPVEGLSDFAQYLSDLVVADCEVIVVDDSPAAVFDANARTLRWVARHVAARPRHRNFSGCVDAVRAASEFASCEKVIVADARVRYEASAIGDVCELLDMHEVVEPQDYFEPMPWWIGIEAGRMLVHRGVEPLPDHGATFGFRRSAMRGLRSVDSPWAIAEDPVRRLSSQGAEVFSACDVFVRRMPPALAEWAEEIPRQAADDFVLPVKSAFFFALLPMAMLLAAFGGLRLAATYAGAIAFGALALAVRGRVGAASFFPLRSCLYAPLWVLERSVSVYWALFQKLRGTPSVAARVAVAERASGEKVASGE
jgi:hypothetical protein